MNEDFKSQLEQKTEDINILLDRYLPIASGYFRKISEAVNYSVRAGGKRLRPILLLEVFRLCNKDGLDEKEIEPFLAAIEFIHTYSLVHDDLPAMDDDELRRGMPTTHIKYGEDFGVLAGDALLNLAYEILLKAAAKNSDSRFTDAALTIALKAGINGMVGGQSLDVELTGQSVSEDQLDFIFRLKTAALIEAVFRAGAILADADADTADNLEKAGRLVGLAFQIRDDILDETGVSEELGKPTGSDEKNNKTTYVTLHGMEKAKEDVIRYSDMAVELIKKSGDNPFLTELVLYLTDRNK